MRKIIHNLRRQPEHVRMHILHVLTMIFAVILIFLWLFSLGRNLSNPDTQAKVENDLKPLSALKANIVGGYESFNNSDLNTGLEVQQ